MWRRREKQKMSFTILADFVDEIMALLLFVRTHAAGFGCRVRFIHNDEVRAICEKGTPARIPLGEVNTDDEMAVMLVDAKVSPWEIALQPSPRTRAYHVCVNVKF